MKSITYQCPNCDATFDAHTHTLRRAGAGAAGAAVGTALTRNLLIGLALGGLAYWASGKWAHALERPCPRCGIRARPRVEAHRTPTQGETEQAIAA